MNMWELSVTQVNANTEFVDDDEGWTEFVYRKTHGETIKVFSKALWA